MSSNNFDYPNKLNKIFDKLNKINLIPIIVGGYVRDYYFKTKSKDIDIEVYGLDTIEQLVPILQQFGKTYEVGKSFGVCKLTLDDLDLDFSMPRIDNKVSKGHKGFKIVTKKELSFETATSRRDFTINTIGYNTKTKTILDPFNGLDDIKHKLLKVVNNTSFVEDPLRVFRAMSMVGRFKLRADQNTINLCKFMIKQNMLDELSKERIYKEFEKLFLKSHKPSLGLAFLKEIDGLEFFYELKMKDIYWKDTLNNLDRIKTNTFVSLAVLCYKVEISQIESFITKLTNSKKLITKIILYKKIANYLETKQGKLLYSEFKNINFNDLELFLKSINVKENFIKNIDKLKPIVDGKTLLKLGFKPSKEFGNLLELSFEMQVLNYLSL